MREGMKNFMSKWAWSRLLACCMLMMGMLSCDTDDNSTVIPEDEVSYVALYNASPDAPDLDVEVDNRQINNYPFDYADYTGYLRFYSGDRTFQFTPYSSDNVLIDTTVTFEPLKAYSLFVVNQYPDLKTLVLEDPFEYPEEGKAMVRFVNLSPDAPALEIVEGDNDNSLFGFSGYMDATQFKELSADAYDLRIRSGNDENILLNLPDTDFQSGWFYTILVRGLEDPGENAGRALSAQIIVN